MDDILNLHKRILEMLEENRIIMFLVDGLGTLDLRVPRARRKVYKTIFPTSTPTVPLHLSLFASFERAWISRVVYEV